MSSQEQRVKLVRYWWDKTEKSRCKAPATPPPICSCALEALTTAVISTCAAISPTTHSIEISDMVMIMGTLLCYLKVSLL